jgi:hypothetical protein
MRIRKSTTKYRANPSDGSTPRRAGVVVAAANLIATVVLLACLPTLAQAAFEEAPEQFGATGESAQIKESSAAAVNYAGEGGVPSGSLYVVSVRSRVARFSPGHEGEAPQFEEAWGWGIAQGGPGEAYVRCGPAYASTANPAEGTYAHCKPNEGFGGSPGEQQGHFTRLEGVAIDQATGNVYVRNFNTTEGGGERQHHLIELFTSTGVPIGEGFGDSGRKSPFPSESIAEGPDKIHRPSGSSGLNPSGLAVGSGGTVYVLDADYVNIENPRARIMTFKPCAPGDFEHYCYQSGSDVFIQQAEAFLLSLTQDNRLVIANQEIVAEYPVGQEHPTPICSTDVTGQLFAMTTNPLTGELFYYTHSGKKLFVRKACDEETGEFGHDPGQVYGGQPHVVVGASAPGGSSLYSRRRSFQYGESRRGWQGVRSRERFDTA